MSEFRDFLAAHYVLFKDFAGTAVAAVGFITTSIFAVVGLHTFEKWKREKIEEKRIDVAIDALAIAYEAQLVFERIRSRLVREYEYKEIMDKQGYSAQDKRRESQGNGYAVLRRIEADSDFFDRVLKLEPRFVATFGRDSENIFSLLHKARRSVEINSEALIEEYLVEPANDQEARQRRVNIRTNMFASPGEIRDGDQVGKDLLAFREAIEERCRNIVERGFSGKNRLPWRGWKKSQKDK